MKNLPRPKYSAEKYFLWMWRVVNEKGEDTKYGSRRACESYALLLNTVWENGHLTGQIDQLKALGKTDLRFLPNNTTEDLHHLETAVLRDLSFNKMLPEEAKTKAVKDKLQTLYGWKALLQGCILDARERESEEWAAEADKEIKSLLK